MCVCVCGLGTSNGEAVQTLVGLLFPRKRNKITVISIDFINTSKIKGISVDTLPNVKFLALF
jgi:hypothetical protein